MRKISIALAAAAALNFGPALAADDANEPPITSPSQMIDGVTVENVSELAKELGGQNIEMREFNGRKTVIMMDGEVPYNLGLAICDMRPGKCVILLAFVLMDFGDANYPLEVVNSLNRDGWFLTMAKTGEKNIMSFGRAIIVDGGVTKKNLAMNIGAFVGAFRETMKALKTQLVAGVYPGGAQLKAQMIEPTVRPVVPQPEEAARIMDKLAEAYRAASKRAR